MILAVSSVVSVGLLDGVSLGLLDGSLDGSSVVSLEGVLLGLLDGSLDGSTLELRQHQLFLQ
jgi:hypothetical protein